MSLFPAAGSKPPDVSDCIKTEQPEERDWLQNRSYHADKASEFVKLQDQDYDEDSFSSDDSEGELKLKEKKRKRHSSPPKKEHFKKIKTELQNDRNFGKASFIVDELNSSVPIYKSDKNSDMDNVHFRRPYKVVLPKFYRDIIYCVGTPKWKYLEVRETRKKKKRKRRNDDKDSRYFNCRLPGAVNFLPRSGSQNQLFMTRFTENYVEVLDKKSCFDDPVDEDAPLEDRQKKITEELNQKTRANPENVENWMKLVSWQDEVMSGNVARGKAHIIAEKKVEILNQGIKANPREPKLQLLRIRLQSDLISDVQALDKEWQNILFRFPDSIEVWKAYVFYINCNNFTAFSLKRTRRAYGHCIEILRSIKNGTYKQETLSDVSAESRLVQILSEYAHFLAATGHTEQLVALYQCMLELNFRGPPAGTSWSDTIDYLKLYFSGTERRIGESGSKGFRSWVTKHETGGWVTGDESAKGEDSDTDDDADDVDPDQGLLENWLKIDQLRCEKQWLPWRPGFEGDECDDEERKVSFSEFKGLMFIVDSFESKLKLLRNFLLILGSPACFSTTEFEPFSSQNMFYFTHSRQPMRRFDELFITKPLLLGRSQQPNLGTLSLSKHNYIREVFTQLFQCTQDEDLKAMLCTACMSYFEHRIISFYVDDKAKELKECGKQGKKIAKRILGSNPNLLRVWCSYGVIEWLSGKQNEACKVFQTTLAMSLKTVTNLDRAARSKLYRDTHFICRTFAQLHYSTCAICRQCSDEQCAAKSTVLATLTALGDGYKFTEYVGKVDGVIRPTSVMKALSGFLRLTEEFQSLYEQYEYEKDMTNMPENEYLSTYFDVVCCYFIYFIQSRSVNDYAILDDAIAFLQQKIEKGSMQAKIDMENIYHMYLSHLKSVSGTCRNLYRKVIYESVSRFSNNPYFAQLLGEVDMPSYLCGNVRRHFTKICAKNSTSVIPWLCSIKFELARRKKIQESSRESGVIENNTLLDARIHNIFEHGLAAGYNMGSAVLWRAYVATQSELDKSLVNGVYTRALDSCSWSRDLHLDVLSCHPDKLEEVVDNMSRKGLRLRTPVEEIQLLMTI